MSRNLYLLAASPLLFSLDSCAMSLVPNALQPGLPAYGSWWKMAGLGSPPPLTLLRSGGHSDGHVRTSGAPEPGAHEAGVAGRLANLSRNRRK